MTVPCYRCQGLTTIVINFATLSNMTSAAPFFLCEIKLNTTERGAPEVIFEKVIQITSFYYWNPNYVR